MNESLLVLASKMKKEIHDRMEEKARELATLLDENPQSNIVYDWYSGVDPEIDRESTKYIIVSRKDITGVKLENGQTFEPAKINWYGYNRYDLNIPEYRVRELQTPDKNYKIRRP